ncbi:MAG: hypothetical protein ACLR8T_13325, partial [Alistipes finegoldii]
MYTTKTNRHKHKVRARNGSAVPGFFGVRAMQARNLRKSSVTSCPCRRKFRLAAVSAGVGAVNFQPGRRRFCRDDAFPAENRSVQNRKIWFCARLALIFAWET